MRYFVDLDGEREMCLWRAVEGGEPVAVLRSCDVPTYADFEALCKGVLTLYRG